jgi:hypothetical protein
MPLVDRYSIRAMIVFLLKTVGILTLILGYCAAASYLITWRPDLPIAWSNAIGIHAVWVILGIFISEMVVIITGSFYLLRIHAIETKEFVKYLKRRRLESTEEVT